MAGTRYDRNVTENDLPAVSRLIHHAFASSPETAAEWMKGAGLEHCRALRDGGGTPIASLLVIPMGQWFGGRSVRMLGIAGVTATPERRGQGLAREMMGEAMKEAAAEGWALSTLYASTMSLYRQVGYEVAGVRCRARIDARQFVPSRGAGEDGRGLVCRALTEEDDGAVRACYGAFAPRFDGLLDRGPYCWNRVKHFRTEAFHGFGWFDGASLVGYVYLLQRRDPATGRHDVATTDVVFTTGAAGRAIVRFLGGFSTVGDHVELWGGAAHPLTLLLEQQRYEVSRKDLWMVRTLSVPDAVGQRGWPEGVRAEATIEVADDLIPANTGRWRIRVEGGRGAAEKAGAAGDALRTDIRGFSALYCGLVSARQAALAGMVSGGEGALRAAEGMFPGGSPWMIEMF